MYSLSIHFGPNAVVWAFLFKEKDKIIEWVDAISNPPSLETSPLDMKSRITIEDDFGQIAVIATIDIHGIIFEDLDLTDEAKILRSLADARNQVKAKQRAATDPVIRTGLQQGGPAVMTPFPRN